MRHAYVMGYGPETSKVFDDPAVIDAAAAWREDANPRTERDLRTALVAAGMPARKVNLTMLHNAARRRRSGGENWGIGLGRQR